MKARRYTLLARSWANTRVVGPLREHYGRRGSRLMLVVAAVLLCFGGGAVMFWFHVDVRGERGPALNPWVHWLLDSTLGFIGLAPLLFLLLPTAYLVAAKGQRSLPAVGALVGAGFALATGAGPAVHNVLVGQKGPLGRWATDTFGADPMVAEHNLRAMSHSAVVEGLLQIVVGLVVYILLSWLSLAIVAGVLALRTNRWKLWSEPEWALLRGGRPEHLAVQR